MPILQVFCLCSDHVHKFKLFFRYLKMYVSTQKLAQIFLYMSTTCCESFKSFGEVGKKFFFTWGHFHPSVRLARDHVSIRITIKLIIPGKNLKVSLLQPMACPRGGRYFGPWGSTPQPPPAHLCLRDLPPINFQLCNRTFVPMNKTKKILLKLIIFVKFK